MFGVAALSIPTIDFKRHNLVKIASTYQIEISDQIEISIEQIICQHFQLC